MAQAAATTLLAGAGCSGDRAGRGASAAFAFPHSLALLSGEADTSGDGTRWLALADRGSNRLKFLAVGGAQHGSASVLAGTGGRGYVDGVGGTCAFNEPACVAASPCGRVLFIADRENHAVRAVWVGSGRPGAAAVATTSMGGEESWLAARVGKLENTTSTVAGAGGVAGSEEGGARFTFTLAGGAGGAGLQDGRGTAARFNRPCSVAVEASTGDVLVADEGNNRVRRIVLPRAPASGSGCSGRVAWDPWAGLAKVAAVSLLDGPPATPWFALDGVQVETLVGGGLAGGMNLRRPHLIAPMVDGTFLVADHSAGLVQEHRQNDARYNGSLLRVFPPQLPPPATPSLPGQSRREHRRRQAATALHVRRVTEGCRLGLLSCVAQGPACSLLPTVATSNSQVTALVCERAGGSLVQLCLPHRDRLDLHSDDSDDSDGGSDGSDDDDGSGGSEPGAEVVPIPLNATQPLIPRAVQPEPLSLLAGTQAITGVLVLEGSTEGGGARADVKALLADAFRHRVLSVQLRGELSGQDEALQIEATAQAACAKNAPKLLQPRAAVTGVRLAPEVRVQASAFPSAWGPQMAGLARSISFSEKNLRLLSSTKLGATVPGAAAPLPQHESTALAPSRSAPSVGMSALRPAVSSGGAGGKSTGAEESIALPPDAATWVRDAANEAALRRASASGGSAAGHNPFASPQKKNQHARGADPFASPCDASGANGPEDTFIQREGGAGDFDISTFRSDTDEMTEAAVADGGDVPGAAGAADALAEFSGDGDGIPSSWTKGELLGSGAFGRVYLALDMSSGMLFALKEIEDGVVHSAKKEGHESAGAEGAPGVRARTQSLSLSLVPARSPSKQCSEDRMSTGGLVELQTEISILRTLRHENIVGYLGARISRGRRSVPRHRKALAEAAVQAGDGGAERCEVGSGSLLQIFLEYVPGGSLKNLLSRFGALPLSELGALRRFLHGLLSGLHFLHTRSPPVVHGDVKAANVLLDTMGKVKIADFGCAVRMVPAEGRGAEDAEDAGAGEGEAAGVGIVGTVPWMAPEVAQEEGFGAKADIWSAGCTVIELVTAKRPWPRFDMQWALLLHLVSSEATPLDASAEGDGKATEGCIAALAPEAGSKLRDLAARCLQREPGARWTCAQLLEHDFFILGN